MFYVDDHYYTLHDVEKQYEVFNETPEIRDCQNIRLAVCIKDMFEWITLCLYIRHKGGTVFPIHPSTPKDGAIQLAKASSCDVLFYGDLHSHSSIQLGSNRRDGEGALIQMSSGTTGAPKCIERTWKSIEEELTSYLSVLPLDHTTTSIVACPVTHSYGLISGVLACLKRGAEPVVITNMNPAYLIKKVKEQPYHLFYAAPTLLYMLSRFMRGERLFHYVMTSGTVIPSTWLKQLQNVSKKVFQQYGCSEAGCVAVHPDLQHASDMGYALPHVKIEAGEKESPTEILIHTYQKTISTKDLGYLQAGVLTFVSRIDDTINVAGLNVYPQEVENVLMNEPRIIEAVVYKKTNDLAGERVCAQFTSNELMDEKEVRDWCSRFLAPHQIPMEIKQVTEIEKLPNGKISRKKLAEMTAV
ncbi:AMP-binding protein [Bacillus weihaiensis]|uniref:Acyl-CoA synthase n=1 Tax=Bacillus weihaiensis TaxID=1547283 RepID=A0A1L3MVU6_9BACI|nr:AMP-binding protein [Bacillus weihaiensis]APH06471.1 acyl-CoA synthase [Bacillus weihaiensis]